MNHQTERRPTPTTLSVADTAARLAAGLGGTREHWVLWLKNDRRPGRTHRIPVEPGPGRPRYSADRVAAYITELSSTRPTIRDQIEESPFGIATILQGAVMLDDAQLREELADAVVEGNAMDLIAFEAMAGLDRNNQPTIWVRSGLRAGMHLAITLPFTAGEIATKAGSFA